MQFNTICVLGLGYIGLPTASTFAANGVKVRGVDINPGILDVLRRGEVHIHEPGLRELYQSALASGNLTVGSEPANADAFVISVPTPFYEEKFGEYAGQQYKLADLRAVTLAAEAIVPVLRKGNLVVLESTSPPRTTADCVAPILAKSGLRPGQDFDLAYSPERVLPGNILLELVQNDRVVGGLTPESARAAANLYSMFVKGEIVETDATTAEVVKLMENTYRDANIAMANEFALLAHKLGVDVWQAISLANRHPRVKILKPGPGVGGHCISVDPWFLVEAAPELTALISTARRVNDAQPHYVADLVRHALGGLRGKNIAVLGLAYKANVDDLRESPAVEVVHLLQQAGASVGAWEPFKPDAQLPMIRTAATLESALAGADGIVLLVPHAQFLSIGPAELAAKTRGRIVVDTVNAWNTPDWRESEFRITRLGVG